MKTIYDCKMIKKLSIGKQFFMITCNIIKIIFDCEKTIILTTINKY